MSSLFTSFKTLSAPMDSTTATDGEQNRTCTPTDHACNCPHCAFAPLTELATYIRNNLSSDLRGNFYLAGERQANDPRHHNLQQVTNLLNKLDQAIGLMARTTGTEDADDVKEAKNAGKVKGGQMAVVRTIAKKEVEEKLRDVNIKYERLAERMEKMQKVDEENKMLRDKVQELERSVKKQAEAQGKKDGEQDAATQAIERSVGLLKRNVTSLQQENAMQGANVDSRVAASLRPIERRLNSLQAKHDTDFSEMQDQLWYMSERVDQSDEYQGQMEERLGEAEGRLENVESEAEALSDYVGQTPDEVRELNRWVGRHEHDHHGYVFERWVSHQLLEGASTDI